MTTIDRRRFIKGAGVTVGAAGALWAAPAIGGFVSPAAAVSGTSTTSFVKSSNGSTDPALTTLCQSGGQSPASRGTAVFKRTESPATICVTCTMSTGTTVAGRDIFILQSDSSGTCLGGTTTPAGTWAASPAAGPQTFCSPIISGATKFVVAQQVSGGGGNDGWSSTPPISLP
jgi:hypothetical protein